jgi:quinol-cytochrome oxidoreductase complex cytochrome b subunit
VREAKTLNFLKHLHSPAIRVKTLHPFTTLGLGIVCLSCVLLLAVTGVTLLLYYVPYEEVAYDRVIHIMTTLRYGRLVRNLHYLAANVLVVAGFLHLTRVFFTGSYQGRYLNWIYGLGLLSLTLASNYTGYLLPWDQTSYWAIKVGSNLASYFPIAGPSIRRFLLGGQNIGPDTLIRSFALHATFLPSLWVLLIALHLWRIRKAGGLAAPAESDPEKIASSSILFKAELVVGLLTLSFLLALSFFMEAPLSGRADPLRPPNPAKAPWYLVGIQEMVSHSAFLGGIVVPILIGLFLVLCPLLDRSKLLGGQWFVKERRVLNSVFAFIFLSQILAIVVGHWFRVNNWLFKFPW